MKMLYEGTNKLRENINNLAYALFLAYAIGGCAYNLATKTGHPSADIVTGITKPTALEQVLIDAVNKK